MFNKLWQAAKWLYDNIEDIKEFIELIKKHPSARQRIQQMKTDLQAESNGKKQ